MIDANTAYRGRIRIGFGSDKETDLVSQIGGAANATVEDVMKDSYFNLHLGAGLEKRVGSSRVVGVYGGEFNVGLGSSKTTYEYGNAIGTNNQVTSRPTEVKRGSTFMVGLNAFAGVEWFCAPKISLSGEYTWGLALSSTGFGESSTEGWDAANSTVTSTTTETGTKEGHFSLDTGLSAINLGINFYFQ